MSDVRIAEGQSFTDVEQALLACCHAERWAATVAKKFPLSGMEALHAAADDAFGMMEETDWLEAFAQHPRIGDVEDLRGRFAGSGAMSEDEQAGVGGATDEVLEQLAAGNVAYEEKFGFVYLVRAAGRTAPELLAMQERRLAHDDRELELITASLQQREITHLRLAATFVAAPPVN